MGIYYLDQIKDDIIHINVDIVSHLSSDAQCVIKCFRFLREQNFFKEIDKPNYTLFVDCGAHFRNQNLTGYLFKELVELENPIIVNLNFFGEKVFIYF